MATSNSGIKDPVYFWKETDPETGWLSQWFYCPFRDDKDTNKIYKTAEHYMMHHKALLFNDAAIAAQVLRADHPREVKSLGRKVSGFSEEVWVAERDAVVRKGNILKFTTAVSEKGFNKGTNAGRNAAPLDGSLRNMLVGTGDRQLVEASPFDSIWGIGFTAADANAQKKYWGENLLGKALMDVRATLSSAGT